MTPRYGRESENPDFDFLWEPKSKEGIYYKWKVYSLCQSDSDIEWRRSSFQVCVSASGPRARGGDFFLVFRDRSIRCEKNRVSICGEIYPFLRILDPPCSSVHTAVDVHFRQMFVGGLTWYPPVDDARDVEDMHGDRGRGGDHNRGSGRSDKRDRGDAHRGRSRSRSRSRSPRRRGGKPRREVLTDRELDELEDMLRTMSSERLVVGEAMVFCLSRAECAKEIVETITEALCIPETPIPIKIARLHLVSDILHNTSANISKASLFRSHFETAMPEVFTALGDKLRSTEGRITAEAMKDKVQKPSPHPPRSFSFDFLAQAFISPVDEHSSLVFAAMPPLP